MVFKLKRHFSIASFLGIVVTITTLTLLYRSVATNALIDQETRANVALTRAIANAIWPTYADFIKSQVDTSREVLLAHTKMVKIEHDVRRHTRGLNVAKVKIYNLSGLTVFSTLETQIGNIKSDNLGFLSAKAGNPASELTFRNEFYSFEGVISDRNILASYIPIRTDNDGPVEAVFELYSDVTPLVKKLKTTQWQFAAGVFAVLTLLYLFLYGIVRRADRIILDSAKKIRYQAFHDASTGLPNRSRFMQVLTVAIDQAKKKDKVVAIFFVGLDHFKVVNDSLGHDAGDKLITLMAKRISSAVPFPECVFRMGGDEFAIIFNNVPDDSALITTAKAIQSNFHKPFQVFQRELKLSVSIGITVFPKDASASELLIKYANTAMSRAKEAGRDCYRLYTEDMELRARERLAIEQGLRLALPREEFRLHYQPKICTVSGSVLGMEALLRWQHPTKGLLTPNTFLSYLEDTGLMIEVGAWILEQACSDLHCWIEEDFPAISVSVNVAGDQFFSQSFLESIQSALDKVQLPAHLLELEFNERILVKKPASAARLLNKIKDLGIMVSIDDFGTGYSSLSYLKDLPIDIIKIDQSFIKDVCHNSRAKAITQSICDLGHSLGMRLVAEGIEDDNQFTILKHQRCHEIQGFLFCKPVPLDELKTIYPQLQKLAHLKTNTLPSTESTLD